MARRGMVWRGIFRMIGRRGPMWSWAGNGTE